MITPMTTIQHHCGGESEGVSRCHEVVPATLPRAVDGWSLCAQELARSPAPETLGHAQPGADACYEDNRTESEYR